MARPIVLTWPVMQTNAFALTQAVAPLGSVVLNGASTQTVMSYNNATAVNSPVVIGVFPAGTGSRRISLSSADDLHLNTFTITGQLRGAVVTEAHAGPNANTIYSVNQYDLITSITTDLAATNLTIGTGDVGFTSWVLNNYHTETQGFVIQVVRTTTITYSFQTTLDDVQIVTSPTVFTPIGTLTGATTSILAEYNNTASATLGAINTLGRYSRIAITATGDATGALVATFIQQGLT